MKLQHASTFLYNTRIKHAALYPDTEFGFVVWDTYDAMDILEAAGAEVTSSTTAATSERRKS